MSISTTTLISNIQNLANMTGDDAVDPTGLASTTRILVMANQIKDRAAQKARLLDRDVWMKTPTDASVAANTTDITSIISVDWMQTVNLLYKKSGQDDTHFRPIPHMDVAANAFPDESGFYDITFDDTGTPLIKLSGDGFDYATVIRHQYIVKPPKFVASNPGAGETASTHDLLYPEELIQPGVLWQIFTLDEQFNQAQIYKTIYDEALEDYLANIVNDVKAQRSRISRFRTKGRSGRYGQFWI